MRHEERRTAKRSRPLSLLLLAALLAPACSSRQDAGSAGVNANAGQAQLEAPQPGTAMSANANTRGTAGKVAHGNFDAREEERGAGGESYAKIDENPFLDAARAPLSTFSVDVDTASYSNTRRFLKDGRLPPRDAVRIEELVNYFTYEYPQPDGQTPFSVTAEVASAWKHAAKLFQDRPPGEEGGQEECRPQPRLPSLSGENDRQEPSSSLLRTLEPTPRATASPCLRQRARACCPRRPATSGRVIRPRRVQAGGSQGGSGIRRLRVAEGTSSGRHQQRHLATTAT